MKNRIIFVGNLGNYDETYLTNFFDSHPEYKSKKALNLVDEIIEAYQMFDVCTPLMGEYQITTEDVKLLFSQLFQMIFSRISDLKASDVIVECSANNALYIKELLSVLENSYFVLLEPYNLSQDIIESIGPRIKDTENDMLFKDRIIKIDAKLFTENPAKVFTMINQRIALNK